MSCVNKDSFISSFPIRIAFISFSCFTALAKTSSTKVKRSGERGHHRLIPDLSGKASIFSPLSMMLVVGFCRYALSSWGNFLLILAYWKFLSWLGIGFLSNTLSTSIDTIMWFFFLSLLITLIDFQMLNQLCISGINPTTMVYNYFYRLLDVLC